MKRTMLYSVAMSMLVLFCCSSPASAQSLERLMTAQIPFDFQVGEKQLPAGEYIVKRDPMMTGLLVLEGRKQQTMVTVYSFPLHQPKESDRLSLIFKEYERTHFLAEVKIAERGCGYALAKSKTERRLAKRSALNGASKNN